MPGARDSVLITGASGFLGRYVSEAVRTAFPGRPVKALGGPGQGRDGLDLSSASHVRDVIAQARPGVVIHLAAQSSVANSANGAALTWRANVVGTLYLAEAIAEFAPGATVVHAGSAEVYGDSFASGQALDETAALRPNNPYARSKAAAEMALTDVLDADARVILLRLFNHTGPGQDERFAAPSFAAQIARIEATGVPGVISVGDLTAERDFGDVTDAAVAFVAVMRVANNLPRVSTFNVCSGISRPVRDVLEVLVTRASQPVAIEVDPSRLRGPAIARAAGSYEALKAATDWCPVARFEDTMAALLDDWRRRVRASAG